MWNCHLFASQFLQNFSADFFLFYFQTLNFSFLLTGILKVRFITAFISCRGALPFLSLQQTAFAGIKQCSSNIICFKEIEVGILTILEKNIKPKVYFQLVAKNRYL